MPKDRAVLARLYGDYQRGYGRNAAIFEAETRLKVLSLIYDRLVFDDEVFHDPKHTRRGMIHIDDALVNMRERSPYTEFARPYRVAFNRLISRLRERVSADWIVPVSEVGSISNDLDLPSEYRDAADEDIYLAVDLIDASGLGLDLASDDANLRRLSSLPASVTVGERAVRLFLPDTATLTWEAIAEARGSKSLTEFRARMRSFESGPTDRPDGERAIQDLISELHDHLPRDRDLVGVVVTNAVGVLAGPVVGVLDTARHMRESLAAKHHWSATVLKLQSPEAHSADASVQLTRYDPGASMLRSIERDLGLALNAYKRIESLGADNPKALGHARAFFEATSRMEEHLRDHPGLLEEVWHALQLSSAIPSREDVRGAFRAAIAEVHRAQATW